MFSVQIFQLVLLLTIDHLNTAIAGIHIKKFLANSCASSSSQNEVMDFSPIADVLPQICMYLSRADLCSVEEACDIFGDYVHKELENREPDVIGIERHEPKSKLTQDLRVDPKLALFFTRKVPSSETNNVDSPNSAWLQKYMKAVPKHVKSLYVEDHDVNYENKIVDSVGIFLPEKANAHLLTAIQRQEDASWKNVGSLLTGLTENEDDQGFLILHRPVHPTADVHLMHKTLFKLSRRTKNFSLWGGQVSHLVFNKMKKTGLFFSTLYGNGTRSWSIPINIRAPRPDIESKILRFQKSVDITKYRNSFALGIQSLQDNPDDNSYIKKLFPETFPKVKYVHFVTKRDQSKYCIDSSRDSFFQHLQFNDDYLCLMIVEYLNLSG